MNCSRYPEKKGFYAGWPHWIAHEGAYYPIDKLYYGPPYAANGDRWRDTLLDLADPEGRFE